MQVYIGAGGQVAIAALRSAIGAMGLTDRSVARSSPSIDVLLLQILSLTDEDPLM